MIELRYSDLLKGYDLIKKCIDHLIERDGIRYIASEIAPSTYKGMRQYRDDFGQFLVYSGGDHGFLGEDYNIKFRALHDAMHYKNELTFKFEDELVLSEITARDFFNIAYNQLGATIYESVVVRDIIRAEIGGQIEYYKKHNTYVEDQSKFIMEQFGL